MRLPTLLGNRIRELRKAKKMSQAELAGATGLSDNYIALVEQGKRSPSLETVEKIADAIKVPYDELFYFQPQGSKKVLEKNLLNLLKGKSDRDVLLVSKIVEAVIDNLSILGRRKQNRWR